jgi:NAD(P)-dependent dehydrogenase (short-subunit alcohol dehydrogenase family)
MPPPELNNSGPSTHSIVSVVDRGAADAMKLPLAFPPVVAIRDIRVVGVGPGAVATLINLVTMKDPALMQKLIPPSLGRMATPEEIGRVVAFLAGDGASYITTTAVFADGGPMHQSPGL